MRKAFIVLLALIVISIDFLIAQENHSCGSHLLHERRMEYDNSYRNRFLQNENEVFQNTLTPALKHRSGKSAATIYYIPVVTHIIHNNGPENITDASVVNMINELNNAFAALAPYNGFSSVDTEIRFCIAKQDPNGNATSGITRFVDPVNTSITYFDPIKDQAIKNIVRWNTNKYLNVWIIKEIVGSVAGYAYMAGAHGTSVDGIIVEASNYNVKVMAHEIGHYFNLFHTFEAGCPNLNCLTNGDRVCDTPPDDLKFSCGPVNSCSTDPADISLNNPFRPTGLGGIDDQNDLSNNYMDYTSFSCMNAFTNGQKSRMRTSLEGIRSSLLTSLGCTDPCAAPVSFDLTISGTTEVGFPITITNTTTNATNYLWYINGILFSSTTNILYTFSSEGTYTIKLIASNSNPSCTRDTTFSIKISCSNITVTFSSSSTNVLVGDVVNFSNNTITALDTTGKNKWYVNGVLASSTKDFSKLFTTNGTYTVRLEVGNTINSCIGSFEQVVKVKCGATAAFIPSSNNVSFNTTINFTNTSNGAVSYDWFVNSVFESNIVNHSKNFTVPGSYIIALVANNGLCKDTSYQVITVYDPEACFASTDQSKNWHFGSQAAIQFNSGIPSPITSSAMFANEGVASISSNTGTRLFYTNGISVWHQLNALMPNGNSLAGGFSSTHAALIVPVPLKDSLYYIFTTSNSSNIYELRHSQVNMKLNGGLGDIIVATKNTFLLSPSGEKVAACLHGNGCNVWVVGQKMGTNEFYAWEITSAGISSTPVVSSTGPVVALAKGEFKFSSDGKYLGLVENAPKGQGTISPPSGTTNSVSLYDFDVFTGIVTYRWKDPSYIGQAPYGLSFSPLASKLYVSTTLEERSSQGSMLVNNIYQYNLLLASNAAVVASKTSVLMDANLGFRAIGSIQPAPNGLLYFAYSNSSQLGSITLPEATGALCSPNLNAVSLSGKSSTLGLPSFLNSQVGQATIQYSCSTNYALQFSYASLLSPIDEVYWNFGDPSTGAANISTDASPTHMFSAPGTYTVKVILKRACICAKAEIQVTVPFSCTLSSCLLYFKHQQKNDADYLHWMLSPNCATNIIVEKSLDGLVFWPVTQVDAYTADTFINASANYYYRLKVFNTANEYFYSSTVFLDKKNNLETQDLVVFPNPSEQWIAIQSGLMEGNFEIQLFDIQGKLIAKVMKKSAEPIDVSSLNSGLYILRVSIGQSQWYKRFEKY